MSVELQIQSSVLAAMLTRVIQKRLGQTCFTHNKTDPLYVDHVDVASTPIETVAADATVHIRVPLDVYLVSRVSVLAVPNTIPVGATTPAGTLSVILEMTAAGPVVSWRCIDTDPLPPGLGPGAEAAKNALINAIGAVMQTDFTPALTQLGFPAPTSSRIEFIAGIVAIRFDPVGGVAPHLFPGQDWGMFIDGAAVEKLALSKAPTSALSSHITSLALSAHWRPAGSTPHVDIDYSGKAVVPDPFTAHVDGTFGCDFSLTSPPLPALRTTVHWSLHIDAGAFIPGFLDNLAEDIVASVIDPAQFGGTPIGDQAFTIDSDLPNVSYGGCEFQYASIVASPAGMTCGGPVKLPLAPGKDTLQTSEHEFGMPTRLTFCRVLAMTGSGNPSKTVSLAEVSTNGSVWLDHAGHFCDVEGLSPEPWLDSFMTLPGDSTPEIRFSIPSAQAQTITEPVRFIVRTARGVRLIDLGIPPRVNLDANGNVTNAVTSHIPNCLFIHVEHGLDWYVNHPNEVGSFKPPLEVPGWNAYLGRQLGIDVQLVSLSGLEPGELLQFRSADHAVDISADRQGRALVPVLLQVAETQAPARLIRVNRRGIAGHYAG